MIFVIPGGGGGVRGYDLELLTHVAVYSGCVYSAPSVWPHLGVVVDFACKYCNERTNLGRTEPLYNGPHYTTALRGGGGVRGV